LEQLVRESSKEHSMFNTGKNREQCERLRDSLETSASATALPTPLQKHLAECVECQTAADELLASRALLQKMPLQAAEPGPWFAARVMAAIAARESTLQRSLEAWTVVPKFAARLTWISALALLLAGTWLYQAPKTAPKSGNGSSVESLFDVAPASAAQDDVLIGFEGGQ
jgi:hypothetical protein